MSTAPINDEDMSDEEFNQFALKQLNQLNELGVIDYVLPTEPLGEQWVIGYETHIIKLNTRGEVIAFLAGGTVTARYLTGQ